MKSFRLLLLAPCSLLLAAPAARCGVADSAVHQSIAGIDVVLLKTGVQDVVTIRGTIPAGDARSPDDNPAIAELCGSMLDKGTTQHDKFAIAQMLGDVGANLSFAVSNNALQISGRCLRKDLPLVLSLLAEQLRSPAFSPAEFAKLKTQLTGRVKRSLESTDFRAGDKFTRAVYPLGHPNRDAAPEEILAGSEKATLEQVKAFYAKYYGPAAMRLVVVGDVDPAAAQADLAKSFAGWTGGSPAPKPAVAGSVDAPRDQAIFMPEKTNVSVVWGQATQLRYGDPDTLALRLGTAILGSGFTGRLMATVRDKEGLTYNIGSYVSQDTFVDGDWRIEADFAPALLNQGLDSTKRELLSWYRNGVTDAELTRAKGDFVGSYKVGLATTGGMASTILNTLNRDLPLSFIDDFDRTVNSLTKDKVNHAIQAHLNPDNMVVIKAGTILGAGAK
ncbi:MAG TPA: pitrilysin family protein [Opitutaceae bacterium]|nr:pitrilysin family protein [Opitutaceae bacterium]